ncbi:MAG: barstar family protein [Bdellovibrionaceae bacterium]|nr:barstar family protein [Pseudobdellovibrionaceae bacterium]MDW8190401.1 barstar family protein [Pseudobdellovibrionaceae bacterium]
MSWSTLFFYTLNVLNSWAFSCSELIFSYEITDESDWHQKVAAILEVPEYYGYNLDALYDILVTTEYPYEFTICVLGKEDLISKLGPERFSLWVATFDDALKVNPRAPRLTFLPEHRLLR